MLDTRAETGSPMATPADPTESRFSICLRRDTEAAHAATEAAFAPFVRDPARHLTGFLLAQRSALRALSEARDGAPVAEEGTLLCELLDALDLDLCRTSDRFMAEPGLVAPGPLDTLAVGYIVLGARLGTRVLARQVTEAGMPLPRAFMLTLPDGAWRAFRTRLDTLPHDAERARRLTADARAGFDLHRAAAARVWTSTQDRRS